MTMAGHVPTGTLKQQRGRIRSLITSSEGGVVRLSKALAATDAVRSPARKARLERELAQLRVVLADHREKLAAWDARHGPVT